MLPQFFREKPPVYPQNKPLSSHLKIFPSPGWAPKSHFIATLAVKKPLYSHLGCWKGLFFAILNTIKAINDKPWSKLWVKFLVCTQKSSSYQMLMAPNLMMAASAGQNHDTNILQQGYMVPKGERVQRGTGDVKRFFPSRNTKKLVINCNAICKQSACIKYERLHLKKKKKKKQKKKKIL